ncbi:MAG: DUF3781 domain-containing protein [Firmicutes bacterium]|nr:DUF3781 domain-containing protein [Bacillota bacterium]
MKEKNDLLLNIDNIHTTPMGAERIRRNLKLSAVDVVAYCKQQIQGAGEIIRKGKNWYAYTGSAIITVNAHSFTIITAHLQPNGK